MSQSFLNARKKTLNKVKEKSSIKRENGIVEQLNEEEDDKNHDAEDFEQKKLEGAQSFHKRRHKCLKTNYTNYKYKNYNNRKSKKRSNGIKVENNIEIENRDFIYSADDSVQMLSSDVESFRGNIVYNLDGSAYIIDAETAIKAVVNKTPDDQDGEVSVSTSRVEDEVDKEVIEEEGVEFRGVNGAGVINPKIHSFRVISARDAAISCSDTKEEQINNKTINCSIQKPILMCFICKLSFGNTKSFILHANTEHQLSLPELERSLLKREYSSAIIQRSMDEKPQISFLQPLNLQLTTNDLTTAFEKHNNSHHTIPQTKELLQNTKQLNETTKSTIVDHSEDVKKVDESPIETSTKPTSLPSSSAAINLTTAPITSTTQITKTDCIKQEQNQEHKDLEEDAKNVGNLDEIPNVINDFNAFHATTTTKAAATTTITSVPPVTFPANFVDFLQDNFNATCLQQQQQHQPKQPQESFVHSMMLNFKSGSAGIINSKNNPSECRIDDNLKFVNEYFETKFLKQQQQQPHQEYESLSDEHELTINTPSRTTPTLPTHLPMSSTPIPFHHHQQQQQQQQSGAAAAAAAAAAASLTIGACAEHANGRPVGVDCMRCEMLLNSARLNSGMHMSTRNSCKTLKCPQCNWHYKYQETLEIHMREKHPDGESACGYCLAGQAHPRLARGESYSCGYKPYRCEICNYSTTTKGNLSIHMQSDKHLNNMQELNNSQNMVAAQAAAAAAAAAVAVAQSSTIGKMEVLTPPIIATTTLAIAISTTAITTTSTTTTTTTTTKSTPTTPTSTPDHIGSMSLGVASVAGRQQKPTFRCDICSYETSVARNLRIHMTSEKHTHNMMILQQNLKHIQAFSYLQQHHSVSKNNNNNNSSSSSSSNDNNHQQLAAALMQQQQIHFGVDFAATYPTNLLMQLMKQQQSALFAATPATIDEHKSIASTTNSSATNINDDIKLKHHHHQQQQHQYFLNSQEAALSYQQQQQHQLQQHQLQQQQQQQQHWHFNEFEATMQQTQPPNTHPTKLYSCLVCCCFNTNNLDDLNQHLLLDRTRQPQQVNCGTSTTTTPLTTSAAGTTNGALSAGTTTTDNDIVVILNNNYICRLCNYKTNLKANFQLHSKTDKHLQKLNLLNHIKEGGIANEYKLIKLQQQQQQLPTNLIHIKCNCCDFYTNSMQKLSLHIQNMRHEAMRIVQQHLIYLLHQKHEQPIIESEHNSEKVDDMLENLEEKEICGSGTTGAVITGEKSGNNNLKKLCCQLCNFIGEHLLDMLQHVNCLQHLQMEQFVCLQRRCDNMETPTLHDIFKLCDNYNTNDENAENSPAAVVIALSDPTKTPTTPLKACNESK